ncbi:GLUG motif-containing protein [Burkholderia cepacia]|uniref:two-partner secretion domain-containing protein n=1 Tax=Burkholderia cepacia TaxID=292 RepID=UPI001588C5E4|nr:GLUG motif-containing protein [Burkholderia cepacia]
MNKAYSLVWNEAQGGWCAVGETARRRGKSSGGKRLLAAGVSLLGLAASGAYALPTGGVIESGKANIDTSVDGKTMSIHQHTDKLITNWQDFSVGSGERVSFKQPGSQSMALNRVLGANGSQILGQLDANGRVFLVNPNGVMFGAGAQVNVGGLVASTQNLSDADFLAGRYRFAGTSSQSVQNAGTITAADGGSVALLGARVSNTGVIRAQMGRVALGAGNAFNVNFDGQGLLSLQVEGGAVDAQAHNGGLLQADGGEVLMTARAAGDLLGSVVKNSGAIEAKGLSSRDGKITLDGGQVHVGGKLDASAQDASTAGGTVTTRGERVTVARDAQVDTRAASGRTGRWTIEAANAGVGSGANAIDGETLSRNLGTTNVALTNTSGDLTVNDAVTWTGDNALTLTSQKGNVDLKQSLTASGANAGVAVNAAKRVRIGNTLALTGENAHLELNSGSGHTLANDGAVVTLSGRNASFSANGEAYRVIHDLAGLRDVDGNLNGRYVLGNAINGNGAQFRSLGGNSNAFGGVFDGLGNTIGNLSVVNPGAAFVGLFASNVGRISNLTLENVRAQAFGQPNRTPVSVGALAGANAGKISNVKAKDVFVSGEGLTYVGGLVGSNLSGSIDRAFVSGRVEGDKNALAVGGLVGENRTVLYPDLGDATIANSRVDVQVSSLSAGGTGGLVGVNRGIIAGSSAAGSVNAPGSGGRVGGLVGFNEGGDKAGRIKASSSSATVKAGRYATAGGLVGYNAASIEASDARGSVTVGDNAKAGGLVGENGNGGTLTASSAAGDVSAGANSSAGGLVGKNAGTVASASASGAVTVDGAGDAGGLVGRNDGSVSSSSASGDVVAGTDGNVGGLVGINSAGASINASDSSGSAKGGDYSWVGGLVGNNAGRIASSSSSGKVSGGRNARLGGVAGGNFGTVENSSSRSRVAYTAGYDQFYGGLVGLNIGSVRGSSVSGSAAAVPVAGLDFGDIRN